MKSVPVESVKVPHLRKVQKALLAWHERNALQAPWRESGDPYEALVAAVMAQQTQMSRVMPSYERFVAAFPTIESLAAASRGDVIRVWAGMGYNQRAVRLHNAALQIAVHGWPRDAESLAKIDGIGPFTAAIIASFAFDQPAACVDTNVRRVLGRLAGDDTIDGKRLQTLADASIDAEHPARWNQAVMDYGARVCTVRPRCNECVVATWCASRERYAAATLAKVAEPRAGYVVRRKKPQPKFEESARYFRGRIIAALRELPPGTSMRIGDLPLRIANGAIPPSPEEIAEYVTALERHGLLVMRDKRVSLPD